MDLSSLFKQKSYEKILNLSEHPELDFLIKKMEQESNKSMEQVRVIKEKYDSYIKESWKMIEQYLVLNNLLRENERGIQLKIDKDVKHLLKEIE